MSQFLSNINEELNKLNMDKDNKEGVVKLIDIKTNHEMEKVLNAIETKFNTIETKFKEFDIKLESLKNELSINKSELNAKLESLKWFIGAIGIAAFIALIKYLFS